MLDDFGRNGASQARGRFGTSLLLSVVVCGAGGAAMVHATERVQTQQHDDDEGPVQIPRSLLPQDPAPPAVHIESALHLAP